MIFTKEEIACERARQRLYSLRSDLLRYIRMAAETVQLDQAAYDQAIAKVRGCKADIKQAKADQQFWAEAMIAADQVKA